MRKLIYSACAILILSAVLSGDSFSGGSGSGGTTVTVAAPYITVGGVKVVMATGWPFTAFFSGSFLDATTSTLTAGTNGSELMSCVCSNANSWYSISATTSVEAEIGGLTADSNAVTAQYTGGIWMCDTTNGKLYSLETVTNAASASSGLIYVQLVSWTLAACAGTPSAPTALGQFQIVPASPLHFKLSKSASNLITQTSMDAGQTYTQLDSRAIGTITKGGVHVRTGSASTTVNMTVLSVVVT